MAFLKRVLSSDYRRALAAEAAGEFLLAARGYALSGEREKVAEMHLLAADKAAGQQARLGELRAAARWAGGEDGRGPLGPEARAVMQRIAAALVDTVHSGGVVGDGDKVVLREAAELWSRAGEPARAGQVLELCGDEHGAAEAYQSAGEVEQLERLLGRDEARRQREQALRQARAEYERLQAMGARREARERLRECARLDEGGASRAALEALEARRLSRGLVSLREAAGGLAIVYAGPAALPFGLGREPSCELPLRDERISRRHAEIVRADDGGLCLRDCGSRNGTRLGGVAIAGELPLTGRGEIGLGDAVVLGFAAAGAPGEPALRLEVVRGADRGQVAVLALAPVAVADGALQLRFDGGTPVLSAAPDRPPAAVALNGHAAGPAIELLRGDRVEGQAGSGARFQLEAV